MPRRRAPEDPRAARGWGPSSTPELKIGLGIAFAVALALSVPWVYRRWRRMLLEEQIETLTATEPPARCRESADGAHDWERRIVTLHGAAYALDVCAACEAARKPRWPSAPAQGGTSIHSRVALEPP